MNDEQKKLPLFDPTFREIIQGNFLYADKTIYIHKMIDKYKCCFLSRPRRFGKTLLLDTVDELFSGNSELFEGLWIDTDSSYEFVRHPVLRFSMTYTKISTKDDLEARIETDLRLAAKKEKIELISDSYGEMLVELLDGICDKYGVGAVVLIDEYDAPVAGNISNQRLAADNCKVLHGFYTSLKKGIRHVRFALVTGITRFAMTALDSGPNNFMDISLKSDFSGICGFPVSELESLFGDRFDEMLDRLKSRGQIGQGADKEALKAVILKWYDGYNWLGPEHVLNPYSILNFFDDKDLRGYWPLSGHPSHLMALVRERPLEFIQPSVDSLFSQNVRRADLGTLEAVPLLFHSGYLTIDKKELKDTGENDDEGEPILEEAFTFRNPNQEVRALYKSSLFKGAFGLRNEYFGTFARNLRSALLEKDSEEMAETLRDLLYTIVHLHHKSDESFYHSMFQASFVAAGLEARSEEGGSRGDADMAIFLDGRVRVVIEVKYVKTEEKGGEGGDGDKERAARELASALDRAENAIREKHYAGSFRLSASEIICLALAVRGRDEVAARFLAPDGADGPPSS